MRLFVFFLFAVIGIAQAIDRGARHDIDAGNQAWVDGMKSGAVEGIAATYAEDAVDCGATGECLKGRAAIEEHMKARSAKLGCAVSAAVSSAGSVQQGDSVYEWGRAEAAFPNGQTVSGRYLTVWQKRGGQWKIFRNLAIPDGNH